MGERASSASSSDVCSSDLSTSMGTSWPTCARVRKCCGSSTRIVTGISTTPSLHVGFLQVGIFPFSALTNPDLGKHAFGLAGLAAGLAFILRDVGNQRRIGTQRFHGKVTQGIADEFEIIHRVDFGVLVTKGAEALFEHAKSVVEHRCQALLVFVLEILPELANLCLEGRCHTMRVSCLRLLLHCRCGGE